MALTALSFAAGFAVAATGDIDELRYLRGTGNFAALDSAAARHLPDVEASRGERSVEAADVLDLLVEARWQRGVGHTFEVRRWADRAVAIREASPGDSIALTTSWINLAFVFQAAGDLPSARRFFERGLSVRERRLGPDHAKTLDAVDALGNHLYAAADYSGAVRLYERALAARERLHGADHEKVAAALNRLGTGLSALGETEKARTIVERSLSIIENIGGPPGESLASVLSNLARILWVRGDLTAARQKAEQAVHVYTQVSGADHAHTLSARANWIGIIVDIGDYEDARPLAESLLRDRLSILGPDRIEVAYTLNQLGTILQGLNDYRGAIDSYRRSLALRERKLSADHPSLATALNNLANLYAATGQPDSARLMSERALAIYEKRLGKDHYDVGDACYRLVDILLRQGDVTSAVPLAERALAIQRKALGDESPAVGATLHHLAVLHRWRGDRTEAFQAARAAERIGRDHFRLMAQSLPEREALGLAAVRAVGASGLDVCLSVLADQAVPESGQVFLAWDEVVRSRALVLDEMATRHRRLDSGDAETRRRWAALRDARQAAAQAALQSPGDSPREYVKVRREARAAAETAERELALWSAAFRREKAARVVGLENVLNAMPPRSALVAAILFPRVDPPRDPESSGPDTVMTYGAFIAEAGRPAPTFLTLGEAPYIDGLCRAWGDRLSSLPPDGPAGAVAEADCRKAGLEVRRAIWDPVVRKLGNVDRIFLVCDGSLALLPLAALPLDRGYLVEDSLLVHGLTTERDLADSPDARPRGSGLLAMGAPDFSHASTGSPEATVAAAYRSAASACPDVLSVGFEPLPSSGDEVRDVAAIWRLGAIDSGDAIERLGSQATEEAFRLLSPGRRVIHLATHGFFFSARCETASPGRFRGVTGLVEAEIPRPRKDAGEAGNPLLLAGVALAGANEFGRASPGEDDGILTAEEMAVLDLRSVEWAVLSGCETGVGPVQSGEGVFGLRRALRTAGVGTVILTLWAVEDEAARRWIDSLYRARFIDGMSTSGATRSACRTMISERRNAGLDSHPFHWAAFTAVGEWE